MKRKSICLRMPEKLFDAINAESVPMMRNELIVEVLTTHFKDRIRPETDEETPNLPIPENDQCQPMNSITGSMGAEEQ